MQCPHCGRQHPNQTAVCPVTGNPIVAYECPNCGEVVMAGTLACPHCGMDLSDSAPVRSYRWLIWTLGAAAIVLLVLTVTFFIVIGNQNPPQNQPFPLPTSSLSVLLTNLPNTQSPNSNSTPTPMATQIETSLTPSPSPLPQTPPPCTAIGQTWTRPADLMTLVCVTAGSFQIGLKTCDFTGCQKEVNGGSVNLDAFWIDQSEVTNAMFSLFVTQTGFVTGAERTGASEVNGIITPVPGADWRHPQGPDSSITDLDSYPVVQINYYGAAAYCAWAGSHLPTEAQWEKAARATDGRLFPWGSSMPDSGRLNAADSSLPVAWASQDQNDGYQYTAPVGSFPSGNSPYGVEDMAGNAWEWTRSLYKDYPYVANDGREIQAAPAAGDKVVLRGGSWYSDYGSVRSTLRYGANPDLSSDSTGFRCVYP